MAKRNLTAGQLHQFPVVIGLALVSPRLAAALQHPQAHHILEKSSGSADATFLGEVQAQRIQVLTMGQLFARDGFNAIP